jgi:hypothetical protein
LQINALAGKKAHFVIQPQKSGPFRLNVFDIGGRLVWQYSGWAERNQPSIIGWEDNKAAGNGTYIARLKYADGVLEKKLLRSK